MTESAPYPTHLQLFLGMQQVALSSFGGGLSAWSERIVVEDRQWMNKEEFITGLTVARLFPGPNQINMAVYIGSRFHGLSGAVAALLGILLLPFSVLMVLGLSYYYLHETLAVDRVLAGVARVLEEVEVPAGATLIAAGAVEDWLFLVADGELEVVRG